MVKMISIFDDAVYGDVHFVKDSVKAIGMNESRNIAELGSEMIQETKSAPKQTNAFSKLMTMEF